MTATITVRANQFPVCVLQDETGLKQTATRLEPHSSRDFPFAQGVNLSIREIQDDGSGDRPQDGPLDARSMTGEGG